MTSRTSAATIGAAIAAVVLTTGLAGARGGGFGAGHGFARFGAGHGFARFGARAFVHHASVRHPHRVFAREDAGQDRRIHRLYWPAGFAGGLLYAADTAYDDDTGSTQGPVAIYRPACRLHAEVRAVAAEDGGERDIIITRCVLPLGLAATWRQEAAPRRLAGAVATDQQASEPAAGRDGPAPDAAASCLLRTSVVTAEDGGERTVSVRRC